MKILFILPEYYPHSSGGIATYYLHYIKALRPHCKYIKVIVGSGYTQSEDIFAYDGIDIEYLKPHIYQNYQSQFAKYDLFPEFRNNIAAAWAMWDQTTKGEGFDIIECVDFGLGFIPWVLEHHKPVVTRLHGSAGQIALHEHHDLHTLPTYFFQSAEKMLLPLSDSLLTHSITNQNFWNRQLGTNRVKYIPPVYNVDEELKVRSRKEDFGLVTARIQKWKGAVELCKAMELLADDYRINWIGRDTQFNDKRSTKTYLAERFPSVFNKYVYFQAPRPHHEVQLLQKAAKFGLVPSTWDMFNFTTVEFMSVGTPVICSSGAGSSDIIKHNENGFIYEGNNVKALADTIRFIQNLDKATYNKIAEAGMDTIISLLSAEKIIPENTELYHTLINNLPGERDDFLDEMYRPSKQKYHISQILDKQPLKEIGKYVAKRLYKKIVD